MLGYGGYRDKREKYFEYILLGLRVLWVKYVGYFLEVGWVSFYLLKDDLWEGWLFRNY